MIFSKYLLPILSHFFSARSHKLKLSMQASVLNAVTDTVKKEISRLFLKIVFGLVATGVLIYSLVVLGQHLQFYLLLYDNGPLFSILFFSALSVVCMFLLFKLFYKKVAEEDPFSTLFSTDEAKFRLGKIYENFMSGLADGIRQQSESEKPSNKKIDESNKNLSETVH